MPKSVLTGGMIVRVSTLTALTLLAAPGCRPQVRPPPDMVAPVDARAIQRGTYLAEHVLMCAECHSQRNLSTLGGPLVPGTLGAGGQIFDARHGGVPGTIPAPNITPYALKDWSDGEILRAFVAGVDKDGDALFPIMPYPLFGTLTQADRAAVLAWVRGLKPIRSTTGERSLDFPMNFIVNFIPKDTEPTPPFSPSDVLARGRYLTRVAGCFHCHTIESRGVYKEGFSFAGGHEFPSGPTLYRSANITPDVGTGIGAWSEDDFVGRFTAFRDPEVSGQPLPDGIGPSPMPWLTFAGMTDDDLRAIYAYLQTQPPVAHPVVRQEHRD